MREDDVAGLLKFDKKMLRARMTSLKNDKFLQVISTYILLISEIYYRVFFPQPWVNLFSKTLSLRGKCLSLDKNEIWYFVAKG